MGRGLGQRIGGGGELGWGRRGGNNWLLNHSCRPSQWCSRRDVEGAGGGGGARETKGLRFACAWVDRSRGGGVLSESSAHEQVRHDSNRVRVFPIRFRSYLA